VLTLPPTLEPLVAETRARVRLGFPWWLRPWLAGNVAAITLGRTIFVSEHVAQRTPAYVERLLRHELTHVRQVLRHGVVTFLILYVSEFVRHLMRVRSFEEAYRRISFEVEAEAAEEDARQTAL
jgi:hypothetical protein